MLRIKDFLVNNGVACIIGSRDVALDEVAASAGCEDGLEVDVVAMGDDTDANFPAIYDDLFTEKTFDPSSGGWSYAVLTSYGLPEWGGGELLLRSGSCSSLLVLSESRSF